MATQEENPPQDPLVFIHYWEKALRYGFVCDLKRALNQNGVKMCGDQGLISGARLDNIFKMIEESRIALVIFSSRCTESKWILEELVRIKQLVEEDKLVVIPVFYKLTVSEVKDLKGKFGDNFWDLKTTSWEWEKLDQWEEALDFFSRRIGFVFDEGSDNKACFINNIVEQVKIEITRISLKQIESSHVYGFLSHLVKVLESYTITSQLAIIIAFLLLLFLCLGHVAYMSTPVTGAIDRVVEKVPKVVEYIPAERSEIPRDKFTEFSINPENLCKEICSNSPMDGKVKPPNIQVFINFRGEQLRNNFVGYLVAALRGSGINVFIDNHEQRGEDLNTLFKRIEVSGIAIVVFSSKYTESKWCLDELVKIQERVHQRRLKVLPIFYKVTPGNVKRLKGEFGDHFRDKEYKYASDEPKIKRWKEAILFVSHKFALTFDEKSSELEIDFIETIVKEVLKMLQAFSTGESGPSS